MNFKFILILFTQITLVAVKGQTFAEHIQSNLASKTCLLNDSYWKLIRWFFGRITYIEITEITKDSIKNVKFANSIIHELSKGKATILNPTFCSLRKLNIFIRF